MRMLGFGRKERRTTVADVIIREMLNNSQIDDAEARVGATAAVEMASGLIQRGLMAAVLKPTETYGLTPHLMGAIGRALARRGEVVAFINRREVTITPANSHTVTGRYTPDTWRYELTFQGPSQSTTIKRVRSADVLHFRWSYDVSTPWIGVGPLQSATLDARLMGAIVKRLGDEVLTPTGYFIPIPKTGGTDSSVELLKGDIKAANGSSLLVESMADGWQSGGRGQVNHDWQARRFGANPPEIMGKLYTMVTNAIIGAYGFPPALFSDDSATNTRESWRMALFGVLNPLAQMIEAEVTDKLMPVRLDFSELQASDLQGRARAFKALIDGGMPLAQAMQVSGFNV